jgi:glycosyltransferase involved in cell wall biosynthesis
MELAIVIPTYQRKDNTTPEYLKRALLSIKEQTHQDYMVYLIGDNYENDAEFKELATSIIDSDKIKYVNLSNAVEREKYPIGDKKLWASGGVNASNIGIELAIKDGYEFICHLDHDDWWTPDHLSFLNDKTGENYLVIATMGKHFKGMILPKNSGNPFYPKSSNLIRSTTCINFRKTPLRYRDVYAEDGVVYPADADLWNRLSDYMVKNNKTGYLVNEVTCYHEKERC